MAQHIDRDFKTILLTWNPKKWAWESLPEMAEETAREGTCIDSWSVSHTKDIRPGDRFFLLHVGAEPRGIMASGSIVDEPESKPHWDGSERSALFVEIEYDRLFAPHERILPLAELKRIAPGQHWTPQSSGTQLREEYVAAVERAWLVLTSSPTAWPQESRKAFLEGTALSVRVTQYERDPRNREACIRHYGLRCSACDFDFEEVYGELGRGFIHVHHLHPLGSSGGSHRVDPIADMRPLCPNCHAIVHRGNTLLTIEELQERIKKARYRGNL